MLRFLLVGASGLFVNSALLALAVEVFGLHYLPGAVIATQGSTFWNFFWTDVWVFGGGDKRCARWWGRVGSFYLMNNVFLLFRAPLLTMMTAGFGLNYLVANVLSIVLLAVTRFLVSDRWIWRKIEKKEERNMNYYNIHNLIRAASSTALPELAYFRVADRPEVLDLVITNVRMKESRIGEGGIGYDEGLGDFGFWLKIDRGAQTLVEVSPVLKYSPHVLYTNVVEPVLRWEFVRRGFALVHGACLSHKGEGLLVTAGTDTGKTTTILKTLDHYPFDFLSDDMVILSTEGTVYTYPKPLTISRHTLTAVRAANLKMRERAALQIQSRLHSRTGRRIGMLFGNIRFPAATLNLYVQRLIPPPKYPVERLVPGVRMEREARLSYVVVIERGEDLKEEILSPEEMVEILAMNIEDAYGFPPYPALAADLSRDSDRDLKAEETDLIQKVVVRIPAVHLVRADFNWWRRIPGVFVGSSPFEIADPISTRYRTVPRDDRIRPAG